MEMQLNVDFENNPERFKTIVSLFDSFRRVQFVCYGIGVIIVTFIPYRGTLTVSALTMERKSSESQTEGKINNKDKRVFYKLFTFHLHIFNVLPSPIHQSVSQQVQT